MHLVYFMVRLAIYHLKFPGHKTSKHKTQLLYVLREWSVVKGHVLEVKNLSMSQAGSAWVKFGK